MRILLDECVDWRFAQELSSHDVKTVRQMGWRGTKNGELPSRAERDFDAFITVDRSLSYQHDIRRYKLAVVVLRAKSNRLVDLNILAPALRELLDLGPLPGELRFVGPR